MIFIVHFSSGIMYVSVTSLNEIMCVNFDKNGLYLVYLVFNNLMFSFLCLF